MILYDEIEDVQREARARRVRAIGRRTTIEISQLLESLPPDADPADAINEWATTQIRERYWKDRPLSERYPDVADVAAKHCPLTGDDL